MDAFALDRLPGWRKLWGYGAALLLTAAATFVAVTANGLESVPNVSLVFVLPVVIAAVSFGWGPALLAALAGTVCYNFFLIEPRYTLRVADAANVWALALLLLVAALVSALGSQSRRRAIEAEEHAGHPEALQAFARALVAAADRQEIVAAAGRTLTRLFRAPCLVLVCEGDDLGSGAGVALRAADLEAARWSLASRLPTRAYAYPTEEAQYDFWPILTPTRLEAVIGVDFTDCPNGRPDSCARMIDTIVGYLTVALEREHYARQALERRLGAESDRVKSDLLAAVSHDLRTPLSTIQFTLESLQRFGETHGPQTRAELLAAAAAETARLSGLVANLLDMSRIDADAVGVRRAPALPADLAASAISRAHASLNGHRVLNEVSVESPAVLIDYSLTETALANVLENAAKYSQPGSPVAIRTARQGVHTAIEVLDEGPGFPFDTGRLFERFTRGVEGDGRPPGTGLGLAIARGFMEAQGGRIEARNRTDRPGGRVVLVFPNDVAEADGER